MTAAAAILVFPWVGLGQALDYEHNWARGEGGTGDDFGRGVALWHDGTVCQLSEMATGTSGASEMKLTLSWRDSGGALQTVPRIDGATNPGSGEIYPRDIAAGNNFVDQGAGGYPSYERAWMHSVGSFIGDIEIDNEELQSGVGGTTIGAFVSRDSVRLNPTSGSLNNTWATAFTSTDVIEALTVASSPLGITGGDGGTTSSSAAAGPTGPGDPAIYRPLTYPPPPGMIAPGLMTTVGVGGYFKGVATFPTSASSTSTVDRTAPGGYENGYAALVLHGSSVPGRAGRVLHNGPDGPDDSAAILQLGSPNGNTRVTGIAIDPKDYTVAVTGWYEASDTDFDPRNTPFTAGLAAGGRDIFVALYEPNWYGRLSLRWLHVTGTQYDDEGAGVAFDSSGGVYATGWKGDVWGEGNLWIARFNRQTGGTFPRSISAAWQHTWPTDSADVKGLDVAVDHLDRAVFTGRFGYTTLDIPTYCMDFDPGAGSDQHCTNGRSDIFVMRFGPNGQYDWGYGLGGGADDIGAAVATEPLGTGRIAIGGTFGIGSGTPTPPHSVDFDPDLIATFPLDSAGNGDSFASALDQRVPQNVLSQVSFVLDNSGSMVESKYVALMTALRSKLKTAGNVPTDGSVVLGVVAYSNAESGIPIMPWTHIDSAEALHAFADRLAFQALPGGGNNRLPEGIQSAGDQFQFMTAPGAYRHLVAIAEQTSLGDPRDKIDTLFTQGLIDQSSGIATFTSSTHGDGRDYILEEVAESVAQVSVPHPEDNLGMGAQAPSMTHGDFAILLDRFIKRVTVCPGDFDRDGFVDVGDTTAFFAASQQFEPYADWNFDDGFDGHTGGIDEAKFDTGWALGCGAP